MQSPQPFFHLRIPVIADIARSARNVSKDSADDIVAEEKVTARSFEPQTDKRQAVQIRFVQGDEVEVYPVQFKKSRRMVY